MAFLLFFSSPFFPPASSLRSPRSASRQVRCPDPAGVFPRRRTSRGGSGRARGPARGAPLCSIPGMLGPYVGAGCYSAGEPAGGAPRGDRRALFPLFVCLFPERVLFFPLFLPPFLLPPSPSSLPCLVCFLDHLSFPLPFVRVRDGTHLTLESAAGEGAASRLPAPVPAASPLVPGPAVPPPPSVALRLRRAGDRPLPSCRRREERGRAAQSIPQAGCHGLGPPR